MKEELFWNNVRRGCEKSKISAATYYVWRNRGAVSKPKVYEIYQSLLGTEWELPLKELLKKRKRRVN